VVLRVSLLSRSRIARHAVPNRGGAGSCDLPARRHPHPVRPGRRLERFRSLPENRGVPGSSPGLAIRLTVDGSPVSAARRRRAGRTARSPAARGPLGAGGSLRRAAPVDMPEATHSALTPSRCTTRASAGMLARRVCAPSSIAVRGAMRWPSRRRGMPGIVAARRNSARSSHSAASGLRSQRVSRASRRVSEGPPACS
jgi:hypothetical protein